MEEDVQNAIRTLRDMQIPCSEGQVRRAFLRFANYSDRLGLVIDALVCGEFPEVGSGSPPRSTAGVVQESSQPGHPPPPQPQPHQAQQQQQTSSVPLQNTSQVSINELTSEFLEHPAKRPADPARTLSEDFEVSPQRAMVHGAPLASSTSSDYPLVPVMSEDEQMKKALAMSMQEGGQGQSSSKAEDDIQKAIQLSILESYQKPEIVEEWFEDPVSYRRISPYVPVGLKNVGNTCYLNSLLQAFWSVGNLNVDLLQACERAEMKLSNVVTAAVHDGGTAEVIEISPTSLSPGVDEAGDTKASSMMLDDMSQAGGLSSPSTTTSFVTPSFISTSNLHAMSSAPMAEASQDPSKSPFYQLSLLFARLLLSETKAVNPRAAFDQLKISYGEQQDASEFFMFLLEKLPFLEPRFKGGFVERFSGRPEVRPVDFSQIVLDVRPDIYESLDEYVTSDVEWTEGGRSTEKVTRFVEIEKLPEILVLQLQRVVYNQDQKKGIKVDGKMKFYQKLFMDRYCTKNRDVVWQRRQKLSAFRDRRNELQSQLQSALKPSEVARVLSHVRAEDASQDGVIRYLDNLRDSMEMRVKQLECDLQAVEYESSVIFNDMTENGYSLQAVLVHEGSHATSGHYYVVAKHPSTGQLVKFSDMNVEILADVDMQDLETNAYCFIYLKDDGAQTVPSECHVPASLITQVRSENEEFMHRFHRRHADACYCSNIIEGVNATLGKDDLNTSYEAFKYFYRAMAYVPPGDANIEALSQARAFATNAIVRAILGAKEEDLQSPEERRMLVHLIQCYRLIEYPEGTARLYDEIERRDFLPIWTEGYAKPDAPEIPQVAVINSFPTLHDFRKLRALTSSKINDMWNRFPKRMSKLAPSVKFHRENPAALPHSEPMRIDID
eukprot:ANDGO_00999.mRNA.1 Ubiquitin carboxyl-terminal hydrolase 2